MYIPCGDHTVAGTREHTCTYVIDNVQHRHICICTYIHTTAVLAQWNRHCVITSQPTLHEDRAYNYFTYNACIQAVWNIVMVVHSTGARRERNLQCDVILTLFPSKVRFNRSSLSRLSGLYRKTLRTVYNAHAHKVKTG